MKQTHNITINIEELLKLNDNSITDCETIRQIGLLSCTRNNISEEDKIKLCRKVNKNFQFCGLYPTTILPSNIKPEVKYFVTFLKGLRIIEKIVYEKI